MFFLLVVVVGQPVVFNFFLAILVADFEESPDEIRDQEKSGTCNDYLPSLNKPFSPIAFKHLVKCSPIGLKGGGLSAVGRDPVLGIVMLLILIIGYGSAGMWVGIQNLLQQIIVSYIFAHLDWFAFVKKKFCCCCCCCCLIVCCEAQQLRLLWGILEFIWGVFCIINALGFISLCDICFLTAVFQVVYGLTRVSRLFIFFVNTENHDPHGEHPSESPRSAGLRG